MAILYHLEQTLTSLSKAENRIAEVILANPDAIVHTTTAELARQADVSDPMISRFCRSLGCKSFPDFKVQLAKSLASNASFLTQAVSPGDSTTCYIEKRINATQAALEHIRRHLDPESIEQAVSLLMQCQRIEIFAMGGCASIGRDAQHKLFRLGTPTVAYEDNLMQRMAAAASDQDTAVLLISFTGRTRSLIETAQIARDNKAKLIAITTLDSPLAQVADIAITSGADLEDTTIYVPMTTRIAILTVVDILATGLALKLGPEVDDKLKKIKHSLDSTKVTSDQPQLS